MFFDLAHACQPNTHCHPERSEGSFWAIRVLALECAYALRMTGCGRNHPSPYIRLFKSVTFSNRRASVGRVARHDHAVHQPALAFGIVGVGLVHRGTIVPDHDVALPPGMAILEAWLDRVGDQLVEQCVALRAVHAYDLLHAIGVEVE